MDTGIELIFTMLENFKEQMKDNDYKLVLESLMKINKSVTQKYSLMIQSQYTKITGGWDEREGPHRITICKSKPKRAILSFSKKGYLYIAECLKSGNLIDLLHSSDEADDMGIENDMKILRCCLESEERLVDFYEFEFYVNTTKTVLSITPYEE